MFLIRSVVMVCSCRVFLVRISTNSSLGFFFSSRRRHTRYWRDWSSDVCSSDLPPHLVFVFCTTDLSKMLPTVRSRCQTFAFSRPRLPELVRLLRRVADGEGIDVPDAALSLIARGARGSFRDAVSALDQLAAATERTITVQSVLQLLGAVEEDALFRLFDPVVDGDTSGALLLVEELADQGQDLGRVVTDLLEHLRHLLLVQHMGEVPESLPVTDETRERLREQANQLPEPTVLRLCDLLAVAVDDMRQGRSEEHTSELQSRQYLVCRLL